MTPHHAASTATARMAPPSGKIARTSPTTTAAESAVTTRGITTRTIRSWIASTSETMRAIRSPRRPAASRDGERRSSRSYTLRRICVPIRSAPSWVNSRST